MKPDKYVAAVRGWLADPVSEAGIHLADEGDGWEYRSYPEVADLSWSIATLMRQNGMAGGGGVCVIMPTGFPCAAAFYAVWACGGVFTPVGPPMYEDLDQYIAHVGAVVEQAEPILVLTSVEFEGMVQRAMSEAGRRDGPLIVDVATLPPAPTDRVFGEPGECALLQFTSGSTGVPRGVRVSWQNLANNVAMISDLLGWIPGEGMASWLPLYHDMGLVGAFLHTVTNQGDLYLMRPDQFVRDPVRWLRAMTKVQHTPSPSFSLGYIAHRVRPEDIAGLDLSGWRTLAVGSEPVEVADLQSFADLTAPQGFSMSVYTLAYGLAEATLMVSSSARDRPITALRVDNPSLRFGEPVHVLEARRLDDIHRVEGAGWITGLGYSIPESRVRVVDADGSELPDGTLGEMVVEGDSVALGYSAPPGPASSTRIENGVLYTGDAGFRYRDEVFVLGRMGSSLKVRGRSVFMEDIESRVSQETGLTKGKLAAVAITEPGAAGIALFAEARPGEWIAETRRILRGELGPAQTVDIITGPRGIIHRTSSGKPRRRHMWQLFRDGALADAVLHRGDEAGTPAGRSEEGRADGAADQSTGVVAPVSESREWAETGDNPAPSLPANRVRQLLDAALRHVAVPADSAVLFEGSLAEGFGNAGSDVDFLVVAAGDEEMPTLPTVLFVDGRRVEIRTRSVAQLRRQLTEVASADDPTDLDEDVLNRCQRFLRASLVQDSAAAQLDVLRSLLPHDEFAARIGRWWAGRARQALRYAVALRALGVSADADEWAADGLLQAVKSWAAAANETYVETKWLPEQLDRILSTAGPDNDASDRIDRYRALAAVARSQEADAGWWPAVLQLAGELGIDGVVDDPAQVLLARVPAVTTWQIGTRVHVLRGDADVFVLSEPGARAWRSVVLRHSLRVVLDNAKTDIGPALAEFVRLGLVAVQWRGGDRITPALAMCAALRPYSPVPATATPALDINGATGAGSVAALVPLPANRFTECGTNLVWSNIVLENAREDLVGAMKNGQGAVADIASHRLIAMATRVALSAFGIHPLPADVAALPTLERLLPSDAHYRDRLLDALSTARDIDFGQIVAGGDDKISAMDVLDDYVRAVREVAGGADFPASFDSRQQWRRTLAIGYDWLRMCGYLDTELPIDEARDLLTSGGQQPHLRESEQ